MTSRTKVLKVTIMITGLFYGGLMAGLVATMDASLLKIMIVGIVAAAGAIALMFILDPLQRRLSRKKSERGKADTS